MNSFLRVIHIAYIFLVFAPVALVVTLLALLLLCITSVISQRFAFVVWARAWARTFCWLTPLKVKVSGKHHLVSGQSYIVVANHSSQYDIPLVIGWVPLDLKWVAKHELKNTLIVGTAGKVLGNVFIDRRNSEAAIASIEAAKSKIVGGTSMMFFPEGTRSKIGKMLPFKKGAFVMAQDMKLPLLPVSVCNAGSILKSGSIVPNIGEVEVKIHAPVMPEQFEQLSAEEFANQTRAKIEAAL